MSRKREYVKAEAGQKPAVRVGFGGKTLNDYYSILRIAREVFGVPQATLCRQILVDWVRLFRNEETGGGTALLKKMQTALNLMK